MKQIFTKGNMPSPIAAFARQLQGNLIGQKETEFWEASSITEFEKNASEIGYEIVPAMDMSTSRGYLVGFSVDESPIVGVGQSYAQLKMYFIELSLSDFNAWTKKIKQHRLDQELDASIRKEQNSATKKLLIGDLK